MDMKLNVTNKSKLNLILIGFMGSGKSKVGRVLSLKLNKLFLDTDSIIESTEKMEIIDIFKNKGEKYFRSFEKKLGKQLLESVSNSIISVGGGFPSSFQKIGKLGFVIYLNVDFDIMIDRLKKNKGELKKRPLLQNLKMAKKIYNQRVKIYRKKADLIIDVNNGNILTIVDKICKGVN
jgi:shikimate kinase